MQISRVSSTLADNSLSNLPNSLDHTQPHSIIANLQYCVNSSNTDKLYGCLKRHKAFFLAFLKLFPDYRVAANLLLNIHSNSKWTIEWSLKTLVWDTVSSLNSRSRNCIECKKLKADHNYKMQSRQDHSGYANIISSTAECESFVARTFSMVAGLLIQSHFATSSFQTNWFSQGVNSFTYLTHDLIWYICHVHLFHRNIWTHNLLAPNISGFIA